MRRYAPVAGLNTFEKGPSPNDPSIWSDVSGMWGTPAGSYATCDRYGSASAKTATGESAAAAKYAFAARTPSASIGYVIGAKIWEVASSNQTLTDRTNAVTIGTNPHMAQYGNATICAMGNTVATVSATGGNFAALAGAPKGEIALTCANAALILNGDNGTLYTDGWWASDVGDYTNWTTGEAANGRLLQTPGAVVAACAFRNAVYAFKQGSILRGNYVGSAVKWLWEVVSWDMGIGEYASTLALKHAAVSTKRGVAFVSSFGSGAANDPSGMQIHLVDGVSDPVLLNPDTYLTPIYPPILNYDPVMDMLIIQSKTTDRPYFYCFESGLWGRGVAPAAAGFPVCGKGVERRTHYTNAGGECALPALWAGGVDVFNLYSLTYAANSSSGVAYIETALNGSADVKTLFSGVIPLLRRRSTTPNVPAITLTYTTYTDQDGQGAGSPAAGTANSSPLRFDFTTSSNFLKVKLTFTGGSVDIDDVLIKTTPAGKY